MPDARPAIDIRTFDPHAASPVEWRRYHIYRKLLARDNDPDDPVLDDADFELDLKTAWPLYENHRLLAIRENVIAGSLGYSFRREGTEDYPSFAPFVHAWGGVLEPNRRQGIATALLRPLLAFMDETGRTTLTVDARRPEGHAFLRAIGAGEKHRMMENRLRFAGLDWPQLDAWETAAAATGPGLQWEIHAGRVPLERLCALLPQLSALLADVPLGALELPPLRFELPRYIARYEEMDRHGGQHFLMLLMQGEQVVAMCEAAWDARFPDRAQQELTAVAPAWRGRRLGRGVKAAMLRLVHERHGDVEVMITYNAEINAPMLAINRQLGFEVHKQVAAYQIGRDALRDWLATR